PCPYKPPTAVPHIRIILHSRRSLPGSLQTFDKYATEKLLIEDTLSYYTTLDQPCQARTSSPLRNTSTWALPLRPSSGSSPWVGISPTQTSTASQQRTLRHLCLCKTTDIGGAVRCQYEV